MTATGAIAGLIPTVQSVGLLRYNIRAAAAKKKRLRSMLGSFTGAVVGSSVIKETSNIIKGL